MRLPLVFLPTPDNNETAWIRSDGWTLANILNIFDFQCNHTKQQCKAAVTLRQKALMAHEREVETIAINDHQISLLQLIVEKPENHLKETISIGQGPNQREVELTDYLNDPQIVTTLLAIEQGLNGDSDLYDEDEGIQELRELKIK